LARLVFTALACCIPNSTTLHKPTVMFSCATCCSQDQEITYTGPLVSDSVVVPEEDAVVSIPKIAEEVPKIAEEVKYFVMNDGSYYKGEMQGGRRHGRGKQTWINGKTYEGQWRDGMMHGKGTFRFTDGRSYEGDYVNDKKHGAGTFTWPDGRWFKGEWQDGVQHGSGQSYNLKKTIDGVWAYGTRIF